MNKQGRIHRTLSAAKRAFFEESSKQKVNVPKASAVEIPEKTQKELLTVRDDPVTIADLKSENCMGCTACFNTCPTGAITLGHDDEGFTVPLVDHEKCISCKACVVTCPVINNRKSNFDQPACYAFLAEDDIRLESSSGGIFSMLANYIFAHGGVVCGAAFTDELRVEHVIIDNPGELYRLRGSKYVQSDVSGVFHEIKKLLSDDRWVLFAGCPCQVAGLKSFLKKDYEKLLLMDLVCHGVPSPEAFKKYLEETCDLSKIKEFKFRTKAAGYNCLNLEIVRGDGTSELRPVEVDPYEKCFHKSIMLRKSCYNCQFCEAPRPGDITAGDFWGISQFDPGLNDGKGTSLVLINSKKGEKVFHEIKENAKQITAVPIEYALRNNRFKSKIGLDRNKRLNFFRLLQTAGFTKAAEYAVQDKYDVAIMGVWPGCNYGSVATYYALHEVIRGFGLSVLMIDKPLLGKNDPEQSENHSRSFAKRHYAISRKYKLSELSLLNLHVDTFVMGCDQVWNRGISRNFGMAYYFDFVDKTKKKISYASSFGHSQDFSSPSEVVAISEYLSRFDHISVREADGVKICDEVYGVKAAQVLDPVFVADKSIFAKLTEEAAANNRKNKDEKYICTYILDPTEEKNRALKWVSEKLGLKLINVLDGLPWTTQGNTEKMQGMGEIPTNVQVEDWLYYIKNCEFLITDSCHGMSFGIIFERPFIGIANARRGISRFESLLGLFDLKDRYVTDPLQIIENQSLLEPIDYERVNAVLASEKKRSKEWLKNALFSDKKVKTNCVYSVYNNCR